MINPVTVMKVYNERKEFLESNPHLYPFMKKWFAGEMKQGTVIEVTVRPPDQEPETMQIEINQSEEGFFTAVRHLFG